MNQTVTNKPLIAEVTRGNYAESEHHVVAVVTDSQGLRVKQWGDVDRLVFPRSTAKPLQAMPLVTSGAAQHLQLTQQQLALACASHNGELLHTQAVSQWLQHIDMDDTHLACGIQWPGYEPALIALAHTGENACQIHNNCSGKHCGFLSLAKYHGYPVKGYIHAEHPVQQEVNKALGALMDVDVFAHPMGIDGCSIPTYAIPTPCHGFCTFW